MVHKDQYEAFYAAHPGVCKTVIQKVYSWKVSVNPYTNYSAVGPSHTPNSNSNGQRSVTPNGGTTPTVASQSSPVIRASNLAQTPITSSERPLVKTRIPQRIMTQQSPPIIKPLRESTLLRQPNC